MKKATRNVGPKKIDKCKYKQVLQRVSSLYTYGNVSKFYM